VAYKWFWKRLVAGASSPITVLLSLQKVWRVMRVKEKAPTVGCSRSSVARRAVTAVLSPRSQVFWAKRVLAKSSVEEATSKYIGENRLSCMLFGNEAFGIA
jgi:hypothetical protein